MEKLLTLLRKDSGKMVSGSQLSQILGVSRTAVWKKVNQLRAKGYRIESTPSAGYCYVSAPDALLPEEIRNGLHTQSFGREIYYKERIDSTNRMAGDLAREGAPEGTLVVADAQTGGKGRLGRSWISPARYNLYFSIILRPHILPGDMPKITLMTAVSISEFLNEQTALPVRIKWPNDLWIGTKKVGGILVEMSSEMDRVSYVVLGIGVNVNMPVKEFPEALRDKATSLSLELGQPLCRVELIQGLLGGLENDYRNFCEEGFKPFQKRWADLSLTIGLPVRVRMPQREITGMALGIGEQGYLRIKMDDGTVEDAVCGDVAVMAEQIGNDAPQIIKEE